MQYLKYRGVYYKPVDLENLSREDLIEMIQCVIECEETNSLVSGDCNYRIAKPETFVTLC